MSFLLLALLVGAVVLVLAELTTEIRTDGQGHREPPRPPSAFDPRMGIFR